MNLLTLWLLLGVPALLALWTLARDLHDDRRMTALAGQTVPRSRPDEVQTRAQMLQLTSR